MRNCIVLRATCLLVLMVVSVGCGAKAEDPKRISELYPNLATGVLTSAKVGELGEGVLLRCQDIVISERDLARATAEAPKNQRQDLEANGFFVLEQQARDKILESLARQSLSDQNVDVESIPKRQIIQRFTESLATEVTVADSDIETFYKENESMFCGTPLDKVRGRIKSYVLQDKRQRFVDDYIRQLGRNMEIVVSAKWVQEQAERAQDNPLDKARSSGKPTLAVFSAASCCGPDRMLPVVKGVRKAFGEALSVVYIEPRKEQILAARCGVRSIPTQIFFDRTGKEVYRHSGFLGEASILEQLKKMGLQEGSKG